MILSLVCPLRMNAFIRKLESYIISVHFLLPLLERFIFSIQHELGPWGGFQIKCPPSLFLLFFLSKLSYFGFMHPKLFSRIFGRKEIKEFSRTNLWNGWIGLSLSNIKASGQCLLSNIFDIYSPIDVCSNLGDFVL